MKDNNKELIDFIKFIRNKKPKTDLLIITPKMYKILKRELDGI